MTRIVTSSYAADADEQAGGGRYVVETHTDDLGRTITCGPYLLRDGMDAEAIMRERAERLNAEFAAREANSGEAAKGLTPWTKLEFRAALGQAAEVALDELIATFEAAPFDADTKRMLRTGFARYREATYIERPLRADVMQMLGLLQTLGFLDDDQIAAIVAAAGKP